MEIRQGEVRLMKIEKLPNMAMSKMQPEKGAWIVGHSETGHNHVLGLDGVAVMERTEKVPKGMRILYAIVEKPTTLKQTAATPHGEHNVPSGIYEIRIKREFNPFLEDARRVAD